MKLRSDPDNPFISPRREAENLVKQYQSTVPGQKGANVMKTRGGKYINYDPTRVRQGDDVTAATGAFTMRGQSKKANRFIDKELKATFDGPEFRKNIVPTVEDIIKVSEYNDECSSQPLEQGGKRKYKSKTYKKRTKNNVTLKK